MDPAKQQVIDTIKSHSNILVTVSTNPSVDDLSAALGLTIMLNNLDKRSTSVFSGSIPPAINFLEPEKTFENSADSLRDFIIALDKEKADHLRYKVEGESVKIFITPYKTQLGKSDLEFSQGDYNVELVIALGVTDQGHLDKALEAHGQILHDATVVTVTTGKNKSSLGSIDWHDEKASGLSEMVASLADGLKGEKPLLDQQISTALLAGIVSATNRFSNDHTTTNVMTIAARLMAAGANQQLIAAKLEETHDIVPVGQSEGVATQSSPSDQELSIQRPGKQESNAEKSPAQNNVVQDDAQAELEEHLAGAVASPVGTMADIEQQLQEAVQTAADQPPPVPTPTPEVPSQPSPPPPSPVPTPTPPLSPSTPPPLPPQPTPLPAPSPELPTNSKDVSMPGFELTGAVASPSQPVVPSQPSEDVPTQPLPPPTPTPVPTPTPEVPSQPSPPPPSPAPTPTPPPAPAPLPPPPSSQSEHPLITQRHDLASAPPEDTPPINSIQYGSDESQDYENPFASQMPSIETQGPVTVKVPSLNAPESVTPLDSPELPTPPSSQTTPVGVPELPPLPPMPANASTMPLPPPPPPPVGAGGASLSPMSPGPISGDIFGDNSAAATPAPAGATTEPGQFKIPGQA